MGLRTNIVIDEKLMKDAIEYGGFETKRETVEQALKLLVRMAKQKKIRQLRGKLQWDGDLNQMRLDKK